ncbi:cytochrome P450 [Apiospora hydei]|uniref:Cytochrome P450 n=1 Tax=Apiospora hydei TaxID=1337664 RepID=A0ABR1X800_9PEZI
MFPGPIDARSALGSVVGLFALYYLCIAVYRLYLSPIAKFPGPRIAAITPWYEKFIDLWSNQFHDVLRDMHKTYGKWIRTLFDNQLSWVMTLFPSLFVLTGGSQALSLDARRGSCPSTMANTTASSTSRLGLGGVTLCVHVQAWEWQLRRRPVETFFSRRGITLTESVVHDKTRILSSRLTALCGSGSVVHVDHAYAACVGDIIIELSMGEESHMLDEPNFNPEWLLKLVPWDILHHIFPRIAGFKMWHIVGQQKINKIRLELDEEDKKGDANGEMSPGHSSIFHHLLRSNLPEFDKDSTRLAREAVLILGAGSINTSTLSLVTYYVLADPAIHRRLTKELADTTSVAESSVKVTSWAEFEKDPYLSACIREGLRTRLAPDTDIQYKDWHIPKNVRKHQPTHSPDLPPTRSNEDETDTPRTLHTQTPVYPEPFKYKPERWIGDIDPRMYRNYVLWGKGSRDCLGKK